MQSNEKTINIITSRAQTRTRWIMLILVCVLLFGDYYCYDNPAALKTQIGDRMGNPSNYETLFSLFYTLYSIPNIVLPFFIGYFIDTFGVYVCMLMLSTCEIIGQTIFATGLTYRSWPIMLLGRTVYGLGGGSLSVGVSSIISVWFSGQELAFAFGINTACARVGSVTNNVVSPQLAEKDGVVVAVWVGVALLAVNLMCVLAARHFDGLVQSSLTHAVFVPLLHDDAPLPPVLIVDGELHNVVGEEAEVLRVRLSDESAGSSNSGDMTDGNVLLKQGTRPADRPVGAKDKKVSIFAALKFPFTFWVLCVLIVAVYGCIAPFNNILSSLLLERDYFKPIPDGCALTNTTICESADNQPNNLCPSSHWYQPPLPSTVVVGDIDCALDSYKNDCETAKYCDRLTDGLLEASTVMSIPYIIATCLIPALGGFVDYFGLRAIIMALTPAVLIVVHCYLALSTVSPVGPLVGQGIAYSLFAASVWPSIPLVVSEYIGLAYGVTFSGINLGYAVIPLIIAAVYSNTGDRYIPNVELFIVGLAGFSLVVALYVNYLDYFYLKSVLNDPKAKRHSG